LAAYTNKSNGAFEFVIQSYLSYLSLKLGGVFAQSIFVDEKIGMEFIASFEIKSNNPVTNNLLFYTGLDTRYLEVKDAMTINNKWQRVYIKGEFGGGTWQPHLRGFVGTTVYEIRNFMVEKGNVVGDWNLAYEDTENKISHIETEWTQTFDSFSQTVSGIDGRVSKQEQTVSGMQSVVYDPETGLSSLNTQLANLIQVAVTGEEMTGAISVLENNINLRVEKGDVINQINISDEN